MTKHTARKALATAALALIAGLGVMPGMASAEDKKPPKTTTTAEVKQPYLEVKLVDILISGY
jgi:hypothetical protein